MASWNRDIMSRRFRVCFGVAAVLVLWTMATVPAFGHARVVGTAPADQEVLHAMPSAIGVAFDKPVRVLADSLALRRSDGTEVALGALPAGSSATLVHAPVPADTAPGDFLVQWRVVGGDDHVMSGSFAFSVPTAHASAPAASPEPSAVVAAAPVSTTAAPVVARVAAPPVAATASSQSSTPLAAPFVLGGLAAVGAMAIALLTIRRSTMETS